MNLILESHIKYDHLLFLGDTHGENMSIAPHLLASTKIPQEDNKAIIHVGDFGIGFCPTVDGEISELRKVNTRLRQHNITMYVVRGNHDDPKWFNRDNDKLITDCLRDEVIENIIFIPDHTLLTLEVADKEDPVNIYCNGGAISIDRTNRTQGRSYWKEEAFNKLTDEQLDEIPNDLDIVVTHTRPLGVEPTVYNSAVMKWCLADDQLDFDLKREQQEMKLMFDVIREKNKYHNVSHYFGHFHWSKGERIGNMSHRTLSIKELRLWQHR